MQTLPAQDPWLIELIVVAGLHDGIERMSLSRDVARGLLLRLRRAVYVERAAFEALTPEQQHVVRLRALQEATDRPLVFSHFSAAVLHGLPILRTRLAGIHTTARSRREGGQNGVVAHVLGLTPAEVGRFGSLLVTSPERTVVDLAAVAPLPEGVMAADALLRGGAPRAVLETAIDLAGPRRAAKRREEAVLLAHPGAESAAESRSRVTLMRMGIEPPELQHALVLDDGSEVFLDMLFRSLRVGGEIDGALKLLDPAISKDARLSLLREKRREDAMRLQLGGFARWGWAEAESPPLLSAVLRRVGVLPSTPRATLADYAAEARTAVPRQLRRR